MPMAPRRGHSAQVTATNMMMSVEMQTETKMLEMASSQLEFALVYLSIMLTCDEKSEHERGVREVILSKINDRAFQA